MFQVLYNIGKRATLLLAVSLFFLLPLFTFAAEKIDYYEVSIEPKTSGSFIVNEIIQYDFGSEERHGIFREIPTGHPQESSEWYKERYIDIRLNAVNMDNQAVKYTTDNGAGLFSLKIGDADTTITGKHTYTISYEVQGGLQYFEGGSIELYWNAIGTEWTVPIDKVAVIIRNKNNLLAGDTSCYFGSNGATEQCPPAKVVKGDHYHIIDSLSAYSGVTVAYKLDEKKVPVVVLERLITWYFWGIGVLLILLASAIWMYRYKTAFKTGDPIIPQYEPYEGLKPMYTGLLFDGKLDPKDITACIVYLAEQGYVKIKKIDKKVLFLFEVDDYEVLLTKLPDAKLSNFQLEVLKLLFENPVQVGEVVSLSSLKSNTSKQKKNQKILVKLKKDLEKDLQSGGYFQVLFSTSRISFLGVVGVVAMFLIPFLWILFGVFALLFVLINKRRTRKGYEALDQLKGFKQFLSVTEAERYKFHNAPQKSPEQFMEYLPYAIALGVEKQWSEVFKDVTIPNPDWYDGGSVGAFSATNLTTSLGAFSTAFASSSGSSTSGGSGGGGSVGGGGGGGGGGSW